MAFCNILARHTFGSKLEEHADYVAENKGHLHALSLAISAVFKRTSIKL